MRLEQLKHVDDVAVRDNFKRIEEYIKDNFENYLPNSDASDRLVPVGTILAYGTDSAPEGFLLCDGSIYAKEIYYNLFKIIGYSWGQTGEKFHVPDLRGKTLIGAGAGSGLTERTLADTTGTETHQLTEAELATHSHGAGNQSASHTHSGTTNSGSQHRHSTAGQTFNSNIGAGGASIMDNDGSHWTGYESAHTHTFTSGNQSDSHTHTIGDTGSNTAHNNMQPSTVVNYIIKY